MAVSRVSADDHEEAASLVSSGSFSHTLSSGVDLLVVYISYYHSAGTQDVTATWNSTSLTRQVSSPAGSSKEGGAILYLANPDIGTYTLAWDVGSTSVGAGVNIFCHSFDGVDTTSPIVDSDFANTTSENQALNISFTGGSTGDMMTGVAGGFQTANGVTGNSQTLLMDLLTDDDYGETIQKAWGADNDLATTDTDYGWLGGIVIAAEPTSTQIPNGTLTLTGIEAKRVVKLREKVPAHGT